ELAVLLRELRDGSPMTRGYSKILATPLHGTPSGEGCWNAVSWASDAERLTNAMSYWDAHPKRYETVVYDYGSCALHDLRRLIGATTMSRLLHDYARAHWYGVSTTSDFKAAARAATSVDLTAFWREHRIDG
ncbi:hypothetical protein ACIO3N_40110, partial [Kitasatospora aureofaciens]